MKICLEGTIEPKSFRIITPIINSEAYVDGLIKANEGQTINQINIPDDATDKIYTYNSYQDQRRIDFKYKGHSYAIIV